MATNLLTGEERAVAQDKPQNLLPNFVGLKENQDESLNPERASSLFTMAEVSAGKYDMTLEDSVAYEETKSKSDFLGAATTLYEGVRLRLKDEVVARGLTLFQGGQNGASVVDRDWADKIIQRADKDSEAFSAAIFKKYGETRILPGIPIKITDVAALPSNMAYSVVSMGTGAAVGLPVAAIPLPGARVAAWTLGTVASGKAAYEMTTYQIMQTYLEAANDQSIKDTGKGISLEEENELKGIFNFEAMKYGLWEAVPEALSNLAFAKILTIPLTKMVGKGTAGKIITKLTGMYGEELITETVTQKGQAEIERRAGLREGKEISWGQAFKEIAPQTFLLTTIMAGTGSSAIAIKNKAMASFEKEISLKKITPEQEQIIRVELEKGIDTLLKERATIEKVIEKKGIESTTGVAQTYSDEEQVVVDSLEGKPPAPPTAPKTPIVEGYAPETSLKTVKPVLEKLKGETTDQAIERSVGYQIDNGVVKLTQDRNGWKAVVKDIGGEEPKIIKGIKKQQVLNQVYEFLNPEYGVGTQPTPQVTPQAIPTAPKKGIVAGEVPITEEITVEPIKELIKASEGIETIQLDEREQRLRKILELARKIRTTKSIAKAEVKIAQREFTKIIKASELDAKDKAKFLDTLKNIQTQTQLQKALPIIEARIARLVESETKRTTKGAITKALKSTKPVKAGQKRVGKFDYESNKLFDTVRGYNKLTQEKAQAEFDKLPEEGGSELDLIKKRFLSLKANGASASAEIHRQVLADIKKIKELGKKSKDEADLEKQLNRQDKVDSALESIAKISGSQKTIMGKVANAYRKGFTNIGSMLNSIGGKKFEKTYNPELNENARNTATYKKTLEMTIAASKIYNEKNVMRLFETMSRMDYKITDTKDGLTTELTKLELIDIYNSLKNEKKKNDYYEAFGKDQIDSLMGNLTQNDTLFGDALQETVQEYREILNKRNIEITGRDLGFIENYWPATSEHTVSVMDDMKVQGETPSALKERAKGKVIPIPKNAWYKAQRHVGQAEHVDNLSREYEALKRLFTDRTVKHAMTEKYGEDTYNTLMAQIENVSLNKQTDRIDAISSVFQKAINNWVTAKIALNPSTFVRQLMSVGNYAENMNATKWTLGFFKGIANPKATFDYVWKNAPFLEARFNKGYSEALTEAIEGAKRISVNKTVYTRMLTSLVRAGDITAIIYGGYPLMKAKGVEAFEASTLKSQQSGLSTSTSQFQNSRNPFTRLFLAFKNTSNQYFRKMADAVISYQNGDISTSQFVKTMTIYAVIQPILYVAAGHATKAAFSTLGSAVGLNEEDEDFEDKIEAFFIDAMIQMIVSPVNAMPIIDDAVRTGARKLTGQKIYKVFSTPMFDDLERGFRALTKEEVSGVDYLTVMTSILEPATALPMGSAIRYYEILTGKKISGKKQGTLIR